MLPLREKDDRKAEANWDRRSFAPFECWNEITDLHRKVKELQARMDTLINRINNCKDC